MARRDGLVARATRFAALALLYFFAAVTAQAGSISGRVQSGASFGTTLVGNVPIRIQSGAVNIVTNTDAVGNFYVTNLANSTIYTVTCLATGHNISPASYSVTLAAGGAGINVTNRNFTNSISLSGRVLGANGTPAPGVTISYRGPVTLTSVAQWGFDYLVAATNGLPTLDMSDNGGASFFAGFTNRDNFMITADATFVVASAGTYQFHLTSDDGSVLRVNGSTVINHDGLHGETEKSGSIVLQPGTHTLSVIYFEAAGGARLKLDWTPPGSSRQLCAPGTGWSVGGYDMRAKTITTTTSAADGTFSLPNQRIFGALPLSQMQLVAERAGYTISSALTVTNGGTNYNFTVTASAPTVAVAPMAGTTEDAPLAIPFTVGDLQTPAASITASAESGNFFIVPQAGLVVSGSGANRILTVTPAPAATGTMNITLNVYDGALNTATNITFTVTAANDAPVAGSKNALNLTGFSTRASAAGLALSNASFTLEFWGRRAGIGAWDIAAGQGLAPGVNNKSLHVGFRDNNQFTLGFFNNDLSTPAYTDTNWHHWVASYNVTNGERRIYRDGQLVANDVTTNAFTGANTAEFHIGYTSLSIQQTWTGQLDEMRVWNHARSDLDLNRLRLVPLTGHENGLLAYWRMDENDGAVLRDSANNGRDATLLFWPNWSRVANSPGFNAPIVPEDSPGTPIFLPGYDAETINIAFTNVTVSTGSVNRTSGVITNATHNPLTYTPPANFTGSVALTFVVQDAQGLRDTNTFFLSVQPANDAPFVATLPDAVMLENGVLGPLTVIVSDPDNDPNTLTFSARSSDQTIVPDAGLALGGSGTNRSLTITPASGESGTTVITLSAFDGFLTTETTFQLRVEPQPAYKIFDLGALPNRPVSAGVAINDAGAGAGNASINVAGNSMRAFINEGLDSGGTITDVGVLGATTSEAAGLNNFGELIGTSPDGSGNEKAFLRGRVQTVVVSTNVPFPGFTNVVTNVVTTFAMSSLGTLGGAKSWGTALNDDGVAVGYSEAAGAAIRAFIRTNNATLTALGPLASHATASRAFSVNSTGLVAGASFGPSLSQATLWTLGSTQALGFLPGGNSSVAYAVNPFRVVVGTSASAGGTRAFLWRDGVMSSLGTLSNGVSSEARAINNFGQIAGFATVNSEERAFLHSAGFLYDLNDLISEDDASGWKLNRALAINSSGAIVGTGQTNGQRRAFLAIPANVIGRKLTRPAGTVTSLPPRIDLLQGGAGDTADNSFLRSSFTQKSYATRPVLARISWPTTTDLLDTSSPPVVVVSANIWPRTPQVHIAGAPIEFNPALANFAHAYQSLLYVTNGAAVDGGTKVFTANAPGWTVAHFLRNDGQTVNPQTQPPYLEVIRTFSWNDSRVLVDNVPTPIGAPVTSAFHRDHAGRNGWMIFEKGPFDGTGAERAHDRATRTGPILPVNIDSAANNDDLAIVWYATNAIRVAWGYQPVRYAPQWPANAPEIVIASTLGSGSLAAAIYGTTLRVYNQPNAALIGFNPNEEHALLAPANGGGGSALFALRDDLNRFNNFSQPFALLKYIEPASLEWRIQPFRVIETNAQHRFAYEGVAGNEIQPPYPLSLLTLCDDSHGVSGPFWEDYNGKLYARAAGLGPDLTATVMTRWWYPLQPGFFYDLGGDGVNDAAVGACLGWLNQRTNAPGTTINVDYLIRWPDAPTLQIGETLINPKRGLPGVRNWASAEVIFDSAIVSGVFEGADLLGSSARLFDPLTPRSVTAAAGFQLPGALKTQSVAGKLTFTDLPYDIGQRLSYDPLARKLIFQGFLDAAVAGEPLLLLNVMSERERERIKLLDGENNNSAFDQLVDALYAKGRNPNNVDLDDDGTPDAALRVGLMHDADTHEVILEPLAADKALTAAVGSSPPATFFAGNALHFDGADDQVNAGAAVVLDGVSFALEFWAKRSAAGGDDFIVSQGAAAPFAGFHVGFRADNRFVFSFEESGADVPLVTSASYTDTAWHHWAVTYNHSTLQRVIYRDGVAVASDFAAGQYVGSGALILGRGVSGGNFDGDVDDFRIWNQPRTAFTVAKDRNKRLLGTEGGLLRYFLCDETSGNTLVDSSDTGVNATLQNGASRVTSTAPTGAQPRFLTLAENSDEELGLPVSLHVIRVDDGPFVGDLKVLPSANVFDEKLPIRHSSDFAAEPERVTFEWYYQPDQADFDPTALPLIDPVTGDIIDSRGWLAFSSYTPANGAGVNYVTLGDGGQSSLLVLGDNYFIARYRGLAVNGVTNWSDWAGDPSGGGTPRAALAEGWIKRVIRGLNPFDQRVANFHTDQVNTFASMLIQAGARYEGDIALNPEGSAINSVGLIEAYETVLRRGRRLSVDGTPAVNFDAANNALLLVSTKIADLYMLLGNESYADAADPTIGFGVGQGEYGTAATSIFAFQNQLNSLLEEELVLLRGRDDRNAGVAAPPVYNRLFWNFTLAEGELAYQQVYNINDFTVDGFIDERDARLMYPQGHGDAWGHYLTGIKKYYELLRHENFTWIPRTERVSVNGVAVEVDFLDERKFAAAAAARAKTGGEIVNLTYRFNFVDDPEGQWQGYKDSNLDRAWGVTEWARRAGQGALFDWMTACAILPATDANTNHAGISKIDRGTVLELRQIASALTDIQSRMDQSDVGLNPLGVAKGAVPFDIDPALLFYAGFGVAGQTHFEQIYNRALKAVNNAIKVWDEANKFSSLLRRNQDDVDSFIPNIRDQELDYRNQLIEIFGYPHAGDIGPGKTYPGGYDGPDLYHYMYVKTEEITGEKFPPAEAFTGFFTAPNPEDPYSFYLGVSEEFRNEYDPTSLEITGRLEVNYPQVAGNYTFSAPSSWGSRRAPGELQEALSEIVAAEGRLKVALQIYDGVILNAEDLLDLLQAQHNLNATNIFLLNNRLNKIESLNFTVAGLKAGQITMRRIASEIEEGSNIAVELLPKVVGVAVDITSTIRGTIKAVESVAKTALESTADALEGVENFVEAGKDSVEIRTEIALETAAGEFEVLQRVKELEHELREEYVARLEVYVAREELLQAQGRYRIALARGERLLEELLLFRKRTAAEVTEQRYEDMTFRIFRNDALQKYRAAFDLAARYVYLAANAYDYELNFLGSDSRSGSEFLTDIIRQRSLGQVIDNTPIVGLNGLADPLGRMAANFEVLKPQLGLNNPQFEDSRFSLRHELFRIKDGPEGDAVWREQLQKARVANLWDIPEFRRYCRPFTVESAGAQPALVFRFPTSVSFGQNFFGRNLGPGDSGYDPSVFSTKVAGVGVWFTGAGAGLSQTPRVYFFPAGMDILRSPTGDSLATREWRVLDQAVPIPFPIGASDLNDPTFNPTFDSLSGSFTEIRRYSSMRAYHDQGVYADNQTTSDSRLIGRSVWNTEWILVIPGGTLLFNANQGIDTFINTVDDVKIYFTTYSYSGN